MARLPSFEKATALVSRALQLSPAELQACFVAAGAAELDQLVALRHRVFGAELSWDDRRYLTWRYRFGQPERGRGECWVVMREGQVLGMLGSESITVRHQGQEVPGLSVMDIAIHPQYEGFGLGVWMAMRLCAQSECVLAVGSNSNSRAIVSKVFTRVPDRRAYAHLIDFSPMLRRRLKRRLWADPAAAMAGMAMRAWRGAAALVRSRTIEVRPLRGFDAGVLPLIEASIRANEITLDRSPAFLNWRLFDNPRTRYQVWGAYRGPRCVGYVAAQVKNMNDGSRQMVIEDLLVEAGAAGRPALHTLVCTVFEAAHTERVERVCIIACHDENERQLRRLGFFSHLADAETLSAHCRDAGLRAAMESGARWHLTGANTDRDE